MKKILSLMLLSMLLFLTGCELPFAPPKKNILENYIESNAEIVDASNKINEVLLTDLKKVEKNKMDVGKLINDVNHSKNQQQDLYQVVMETKAPYEYPKAEYIYLTLINERIKAYDDLIRSIEQDNFETFNSLIKQIELKDQEITNKSLIDINQLLVDSRTNTRSNLGSIESCEEDTKEKKEKNKDSKSCVKESKSKTKNKKEKK